MDKPPFSTEYEKVLSHLNQIIQTQSRLAEANFDLDGFMNLVVEQVQQLTPATGVVVELVDGDEMVYRAATGSVKPHIGLRLKKDNSISGLCVASREILRSDDTEQDPRVNAAACRLVGARSLVVAPLFHEGKTVGVLKILSNQANIFSDADVQTLQLMAGLIGSALRHQILHETTENLLTERTKALDELKRAEEKLKHLANYDALTELPNRNLFMDRLKQICHHSKRSKKIIALLFLDVDHFKSINDTYGHGVGDLLLKAFALRIQQSIRSEDTAARLGGDEFIVLLNSLSHRDEAVNVANKIIEKMKTPFTFGETTLTISTSIGIAFFDKDHLTPEELIKQADDALYEAKHAGRNNYQIYKNK